MIGISPDDLDWGLPAIAHELAHTAVDGIMGGCFATIPPMAQRRNRDLHRRGSR
jgi:hypothetical protein